MVNRDLARSIRRVELLGHDATMPSRQSLHACSRISQLSALIWSTYSKTHRPFPAQADASRNRRSDRCCGVCDFSRRHLCPLTRKLTGTQFSRAGANEKAAYPGRVPSKPCSGAQWAPELYGEVDEARPRRNAFFRCKAFARRLARRCCRSVTCWAAGGMRCQPQRPAPLPPAPRHVPPADG